MHYRPENVFGESGAPRWAPNVLATASFLYARPDQRVAISSRPPTEGVPRIAQPNLNVNPHSHPNPNPNPSPNRWIPTHSSTRRAHSHHLFLGPTGQ